MRTMQWIWLSGLGLGLFLRSAAAQAPGAPEEPLEPPPAVELDAGEETAAPSAAVAPRDEREEAYAQLESLAEVILQIRRRYVEEKTFQAILQGAQQGMLQALDPHSAFLPEQEYKDMQDDTSGKFGGLGIHIGIKNGLLTVIAPIEDTPAFRAGLQSGDVIEQIDQDKTANMSIRDAVRRMRGEKGTKVRLTIRRQGEEAPRTVEIVRDDINVPSVKGARLLAPGVGYVRITQFAQPTGAALYEALTNLTAQGMQALVLDLRSNPGGLLSSAVDVASLFLQQGDLIVSTRGRAQKEIRTLAGGERHFTDFPMAVLVNGGSASASEIVAGALQDHRRAVLIGETTFGKASVQSLIPLETAPKCAIRLTVARYYTPSGAEIHDKGIDPDIPVDVSPEEWRRAQMRRAHLENPALFSAEEKKEYENAVDRPLQRAVDLLQALRIFKG